MRVLERKCCGQRQGTSAGACLGSQQGGPATHLLIEPWVIQSGSAFAARHAERTALAAHAGRGPQ
eukprot:10913535-Alexandrium_andersonii.AAC.1